MGLLNFILLMSGPDMQALASLEALVLYVAAPGIVVFMILLLLSPKHKEEVKDITRTSTTNNLTVLSSVKDDAA